MLRKLSLGSRRPLAALACIALCLSSCDDGDDGPPGMDAPPFEPPLQQGDELPGFDVTIVEVSGGTGPGGNVRPGDRLRVRYTVADDDGERIPPAEWSRGAIMVSGPTFNYQRVIPIQSDLAARSVANPDGSFTYEFADPFPNVYAEPYNYTGAYPAGVLAGQPLLDGTYTVGIEARRDVAVGNETVRDAANPIAHFLVGSAAQIDERHVVGEANCTQCHQEIRAHGDNRTNVTGCLLCHTNGSEDPNPPDVANGTPNVSIDFRVMIHKIHTGRSLPSVLGMTTDENGTRIYDLPGEPYRIIGFGNSVHDFSGVIWPRWPENTQPMPQDTGFSALDPAAQQKETLQRSGPSDCSVCHGDPDGDGPIEAPMDGDLIYSQQTRHACGSCHDDWVWDHPYQANGLIMPPQLNDNACAICHLPEGGSVLSPRDAHEHPLLDPDLTLGVRFLVDAVLPTGAQDGDATIDPGENVRLQFRIEDDAGNPVAPSELSRGELAISGPSQNPQFMHYASLPLGSIGAGPMFDIEVPDRIQLERVGASTSATGESFLTQRAPHWTGPDVETSVWLRTGVSFTTALNNSAPAWQNFVDVVDASGVSRNDYVAIADGTDGAVPQTLEYRQVQWVEGNRLWFSAKNVTSYPFALRLSHPAGATVEVVTLAPQAEGTDFTLDAAAGRITEIGDIGTGDVVVTYTGPYEMPDEYTGTVNESPALDSSWGEWHSLPIVAGTYEIGLWARRTFTAGVAAEPTTYTETAPAGTARFLVADAAELEDAARISSPQECYDCHNDLQFHGNGRRGYESCAFCHTVAGAEDRPQYVAPGAPPTPDVTIDFRQMVHKIHHGASLAKGEDYEIVGFGSPAQYPNNFSIHTYDHVVFPAWPGGTMDCSSCHGDENEAWIVPDERLHPTGQPMPTRSWFIACGSCHDSDSAQAHMASNTSPAGFEACGICHTPGENQSVERAHKSY